MQRLPSFAQSAARYYTQTVYCFPYNDKTCKKATIQHLKSSIQRLEEQCPLLAGTLHASSRESIVSVLPGEGGGKIPLEVLITGGQQLSSADNPTYFDSYYSCLAARGFPPQAFVGQSLDLNNTLRLDDGPIPVCHVRATFVPGGLLIWLSIHHTIGDDHCLDLFTECLAATTRRQPVPATSYPRSALLDLPKNPRWSPATLATLARECPEFDVLLYPGASPALPEDAHPGRGTVPPSLVLKTGRIFVFRADRLEQLRNLVYRASSSSSSGPAVEPPSVDACLAALALAHVTRARITAEGGLMPDDANGDVDDDACDARLIMPVKWRARGFEGETAGYFGNAFITLLTHVGVHELQDACADSTMGAMAKVVARIGGSVAAVDREAVLKRDALFHRVGDCRRLLLRRDCRRAAELEFNTWRVVGAGAVWDIPGVLSAQPDAVRKVQGDWSIGNALILPARSGSQVYELSLELPSVSMTLLCGDKQWMTWVDRVIG